jgi:hypothetical protein
LSPLGAPHVLRDNVATLIKDTEHAAASASKLAEQARNYAFDPTVRLRAE